MRSCHLCLIGSKESVRKQIGMAVPVELSKTICEAILKTFAGINYESVPPSFSDLSAVDKEVLRVRIK